MRWDATRSAAMSRIWWWSGSDHGEGQRLRADQRQGGRRGTGRVRGSRRGEPVDVRTPRWRSGSRPSHSPRSRSRLRQRVQHLGTYQPIPPPAPRSLARALDVLRQYRLVVLVGTVKVGHTPAAVRQDMAAFGPVKVTQRSDGNIASSSQTRASGPVASTSTVTAPHATGSMHEHSGQRYPAPSPDVGRQKRALHGYLRHVDQRKPHLGRLHEGLEGPRSKRPGPGRRSAPHEPAAHRGSTRNHRTAATLTAKIS